MKEEPVQSDREKEGEADEEDEEEEESHFDSSCHWLGSAEDVREHRMYDR